jgi:hypothetical protein
MVKAIDGDTGALVLQVKRTLHGKTWWFGLEIPHEFWEDLFRVREDHGPQTASAAYAHARQFGIGSQRAAYRKHRR